MRIDLGANVRTRDGEDAGSVQRAIVNPQSNEVSEFVVSTGGLLGHDVIVPRAELDRAAADGDTLRLQLTKEELERMPTYAPAQYVAPPAGWVAPPGYAFPYSAYAWPAGYIYPPMGATYPAAATPYSVPPYGVSEPAAGMGTGRDGQDRDSHPTIAKDDSVIDRYGDQVGVVEDIRFDQESGRLRGFVVRAGGAVRTFFGGGECVEIDAGRVERVGEGVVHLTVAKEEVSSAAPAAPAGAADGAAGATRNGRGVVAGVFGDGRQARGAIAALKDSGFDAGRISLLMPEARGERDVANDGGTSGSAGAAGGGLLGGLAGWLVGISALTIPGIGPIVGAGVLASTLVGAAVGAGAGAIGAALSQQGLPEEEAQWYERELRHGRTLVTVDAGGRAAEAWDILRRRGAYNMRSATEAAGRSGSVADARR